MPDQLLATLTELAQTQQELLQCSLRKRDALVNRNIDELAKIIKEEATTVRKMGKLEEERHHQVEDYLKRLGVTADEITLQQLIQILPNQETKAKLQKQADELITTTNELKKLNELNTKLIEDSLAFVEQSIDLITNTEDQQITYGKPNQKGDQKQGSYNFFDKKA